MCQTPGTNLKDHIDAIRLQVVADAIDEPNGARCPRGRRLSMATPGRGLLEGIEPIHAATVGHETQITAARRLRGNGNSCVGQSLDARSKL